MRQSWASQLHLYMYARLWKQAYCRRTVHFWLQSPKRSNANYRKSPCSHHPRRRSVHDYPCNGTENYHIPIWRNPWVLSWRRRRRKRRRRRRRTPAMATKKRDKKKKKKTRLLCVNNDSPVYPRVSKRRSSNSTERGVTHINDMQQQVYNRVRYRGGPTIVKWRQFSQSNRHSTIGTRQTEYHEARYHRRRMCSHTSPRRSPTMVTLHDTGLVECRWWNDGWTVKTVVTWQSSASMIPAPGHTLVDLYDV